MNILITSFFFFNRLFCNNYIKCSVNKKNPKNPFTRKRYLQYSIHTQTSWRIGFWRRWLYLKFIVSSSSRGGTLPLVGGNKFEGLLVNSLFFNLFGYISIKNNFNLSFGFKALKMSDKFTLDFDIFLRMWLAELVSRRKDQKIKENCPQFQR